MFCPEATALLVSIDGGEWEETVFPLFVCHPIAAHNSGVVASSILRGCVCVFLHPSFEVRLDILADSSFQPEILATLVLAIDQPAALYRF